ncbi:Hypothetical predicted protein [Lecanosticta acicola]|uniref:Uncharacterized protein n=1 Tax=Lecanosticta acicola TaxID=111012 RepID=A0AAI8Z5J5_9PEZI|nr:Hypothetical predicted protein [Lecanosticta acicola]
MEDYMHITAAELSELLLTAGEVTCGVKPGDMTNEVRAKRDAHHQYATFLSASEEACAPFTIAGYKLDDLPVKNSAEGQDLLEIINLNTAIARRSHEDNKSTTIETIPSDGKIGQDFQFMYQFNDRSNNARFSSSLAMRIFDVGKAQEFLSLPAANTYLSQPALPVRLLLEFPCASDEGDMIRFLVHMRPATIGEIVSAALQMITFSNINGIEN